MDEYIKREDALDAVLFALVGTGLQSAAIYAIREVPAADVAPKSEVDWNSIPVDVSEALKQRAVEKAKTEVAREIFERLHAHRKFDGHTVSIWLNDLVCIAKEYGIDL